MNAYMDDDYDPLAPVHVDAHHDDPDAGLAGFFDPDRVVRVWLADGELSRVRVSPAWRQKLGHKSLEAAFAAAFAVARVRVAAARPPEGVDLDPVDFSGLPAFDGESFAVFRRALDNLNRRLREAAARQRDAATARPQPVAGEDTGVTVHLNEDGQLTSVSFDEEWLDEASPADISMGVQRAARQARQAYVPDEARASDEMSRLALEHEVLLAGFMSTITGGSPR